MPNKSFSTSALPALSPMRYCHVNMAVTSNLSLFHSDSNRLRKNYKYYVMSTQGVRPLNEAMEMTRASRIAQHSLLSFPFHSSERFATKCLVGIGDFNVSESPRRPLVRLNCQFSDSGHQQYYVSAIKQFKKKEKQNNSEIKLVKRKLKFIRRLSNELSLFSLETSGIENRNSLVDEEKISVRNELASFEF